MPTWAKPAVLFKGGAADSGPSGAAGPQRSAGACGHQESRLTLEQLPKHLLKRVISFLPPEKRQQAPGLSCTSQFFQLSNRIFREPRMFWAIDTSAHKPNSDSVFFSPGFKIFLSQQKVLLLAGQRVNVLKAMLTHCESLEVVRFRVTDWRVLTLDFKEKTAFSEAVTWRLLDWAYPHPEQDSVLLHLQGLPFESVNLKGFNALTDAGLAYLKDMPLKTLSLQECWQVTDAGLAHLQGMGLRQLSLMGCEEVTDAGLAHLKRMPLQTLDLKGYRQVTDAGLAHLQDMPLKTLSLQECWEVTDAGLGYLKDMPLEHLSLMGCSEMTDAGLAHLQDMPLKTLSLQECWQVTDAGLAHLKRMPLEMLSLERCSQVTDAGVAYLEGMGLRQLSLMCFHK